MIALDAWNNTATSYHGTVPFTGGDSAAVLPGNGPLWPAWARSVPTLKTVGNQSLTVTDTVIPGPSGTTTVAVRDLIVIALSPTTRGFVAGFSKAFDPQ